MRLDCSDECQNTGYLPRLKTAVSGNTRWMTNYSLYSPILRPQIYRWEYRGTLKCVTWLEINGQHSGENNGSTRRRQVWIRQPCNLPRVLQCVLRGMWIQCVSRRARRALHDIKVMNTLIVFHDFAPYNTSTITTHPTPTIVSLRSSGMPTGCWYLTPYRSTNTTYKNCWVKTLRQSENAHSRRTQKSESTHHRIFIGHRTVC